MICASGLGRSPVDDGDLRDAQRRFESLVLQISQPVLERYRLLGRGSARTTRGLHPAYVAELRVAVQLSAWERRGLVRPACIGVPTPYALIQDLIERVRCSREEHIRSDDFGRIVGAMFLWWHENCARFAPEYLGADVEVCGGNTELIIDELAQVLWQLRYLGTQMR